MEGFVKIADIDCDAGNQKRLLDNYFIPQILKAAGGDRLTEKQEREGTLIQGSMIAPWRPCMELEGARGRGRKSIFVLDNSIQN
jgi:hypothetical protein